MTYIMCTYMYIIYICARGEKNAKTFTHSLEVCLCAQAQYMRIYICIYIYLYIHV
jgi:hypothetical protein